MWIQSTNPPPFPHKVRPCLRNIFARHGCLSVQVATPKPSNVERGSPIFTRQADNQQATWTISPKGIVKSSPGGRAGERKRCTEPMGDQILDDPFTSSFRRFMNRQSSVGTGHRMTGPTDVVLHWETLGCNDLSLFVCRSLLDRGRYDAVLLPHASRYCSPIVPNPFFIT